MDENTGEIKLYTAEDIMREIQRSGGKLPPVSEKPDLVKLQKAVPHLNWLKRLPKKNCKRCHGVGHEGRNLTTGKFVPCRCTL